MNEGDSHLHPWIEPELEARIIALVLGESSDFETEELERLIGEQPELAMFRKRMETIHGLLHGATAGESEDADDTWKLPKERREAVLAAIGGAESDTFSGAKPELETDASESPGRVVEVMPVSGPVREPRKSYWKPIISISVAAGLILFVEIASFFPLAKNEYTAASSIAMVARPEEEIALAREGSTAAIHENWDLEDTPVLPKKWASQPGAIRSWDTRDSFSGDLLAMKDAAEPSDAAASRSRLKGVFGNINALAGVETGGMTVVSSLDVDSNEFMRRDSGAEASKLQFPITPAPKISRDAPFDSPELPPLLGATKKEMVGDVEVSTIGSGVTIRANSTMDLSEPISTAGKISLAFPEMPGVAGDSDLRDPRWAGQALGHGGRDFSTLASNDTNKDLERRYHFDVNGAAEGREESGPESGQKASQGQAQENGPTGFGLVADVEGKPGNQPAVSIDSEVVNQSLQPGNSVTVQSPGSITASGGTSGGVITLDGVMNTNGGVITLDAEGVNSLGGMIQEQGQSREDDRGRKDFEELATLSKSVAEKSEKWGQAGGSVVRTDDFGFAPRTSAPAPEPSAKPAPAPAKPKPKAVPEPITRLAKVSAATGPVAGAASRSGGLIEVSGKANLSAASAASSPMGRGGEVLFDPGDVVVGQSTNDGLSRDNDGDGAMAAATVPALAEKPAVGRLFREQAEGESTPLATQLAPAREKMNEPSELGDLAAVALQEQQRFGDFDNGMGNSVDGAYINKSDEGNTHSLSDDVSVRKFQGGANNLRGFDFKTVAPADRPNLEKKLEDSEKLLQKGHGQVTPIRINGQTKTKDHMIRRELAATEQLGAGGYDTVRSFEKRIEAEAKLAEPGLVDISGAMGGGSVNIGGGFQGRNVSPESTPVSAEGTGQTDSSVLAINSGGVLVAPVEVTAISNSGSIRASSGKVGGRVILGAAGGVVSNVGSIQANGANGAGEEILIDESEPSSIVNIDGSVAATGIAGNGGTIEVLGTNVSTVNATGAVSGKPEQSLAEINESLTLDSNSNGATVNWHSFSVAAGEVTEFDQPGKKGRKLNRVTAGKPVAAEERLKQEDGQVLKTPEGNEVYFWADDDTSKLNPNVSAGGADWATPMAGGDVDRNLGRFQSAQHESQSYPGHPATTHLAPESAASGEKNAEAVQWSNSETSFGAVASGIVNVENQVRTSGGGDINVALTEGILQQSGGRRNAVTKFNGIGHGGSSLNNWGEERDELKISQETGPGVPRQWREGFAQNQGVVGGDYTIDLNLTPEVVEIAGFINYGSPIHVDRIDGLMAEGTRDNRATFQQHLKEGWELPAPVTARSGGREKVESTREFIYPTDFDPPEVVGSHYGDTVVEGGKLTMTNPKPNRFIQLGFRDTGQTFTVRRVAPPTGLDEKKAAEESFSTFSLHVSDVSFKLAQAALAKGEWPEAGKVRIEEFVNAFDYGDPNPNQDDKVACVVEQAIHPFLQQRNLMRVAMRTAAAGRAGDTPLRLTFLLDNSGSMERADREETVRRAFALLADQLQPIDQVTLISFARQPRLLADKVSGDQSRNLVEVVSNLPSEGGTNLEAALQLAFEKAQEQKSDNAQNRIILLTDGAANLGNASPESLAAMIESMREEGIAFDAAGIGAEGLNDDILEALTRKGDGRYYLLNRPEDADAGFARQIAGALRPAAKNVKVQVEFNPDRVGNYKLLGFEKHRLKKEDFRDDKVDAAEMAAEEAGVAVYQFEAKPDGKGDVGFVSVRFRDMSSGEMVEKRWPIPYEPSAPRPDQAAPSMQIATAAALLAAKLNGEALEETVDLEDLARTVSSLPEAFQNKERVQQLRQMIDQARELSAK